MKSLINGKKALLRFYSKFDTYFTAALKFGIAFFALYHICSTMGLMKPMAEITILLIIAAFCSFLSPNMLLMAVAVYLEGQLLGHSLEASIVGGVILLVFLLLYFSFIPGQAYVVIVTALAISLKIPLPVAVIAGLLMGSGAAAGISFGSIMYYGIAFLVRRPRIETVMGEELFLNVMDMLQKMFLQQDLILTLVTLLAVFLVVNLLRRLPVKYSWSIAIAAGLFVYGALETMGVLLLQSELQMAGILVNLAVSGIVGLLVQFFAFGLDYKRVEYLQFEDDDYYYYVKAVAKLEKPEEKDDYYFD